MNSTSLMLLLDTFIARRSDEINEEVIDLIRGLKVSDFEFLSRTNIEFISFQFDEVKFRRAIQSLRDLVREQEMILEYIKLGASAPMMRALFGHTAAEVGALREQLCLSERGGRPAVPTVSEQILISQIWSESYKMDEREHYLYVARETGLPLRTIWNEINSYDAPEVIHLRCQNRDKQDKVIKRHAKLQK